MQGLATLHKIAPCPPHSPLPRQAPLLLHFSSWYCHYLTTGYAFIVYFLFSSLAQKAGAMCYSLLFFQSMDGTVSGT